MRWVRLGKVIEVDPARKVEWIEVRLVVREVQGTIRVTDLLLQEGRNITGHVPATPEMLKRERDAQGNPITRRHFNVVIRGKKTIAVPNRASTSEEQDISRRVTGGIDFVFTASEPILQYGWRSAHLYRTRTFILGEPGLNPGDVLEFRAITRRLLVNGQPPTVHEGFWHTCPAGFGRYRIELVDPGTPDLAPKGSGYLLCEVDTWLKGIGGERM